MRIVIADDSFIIREGVARVAEAAGIEVAGVARDGPELLTMVRNACPAVAVIDIRMPPTYTDEGLRAVEAIRAEHGRNVGILVLSQYVEEAFALSLVTRAAGGLGYLLKERVSDLDEFASAVRRVASGSSVLDPAIVNRLLQRPVGIAGALTDREREVLTRMAEGRSNQAIATQMGVSLKTVEAYVNVIFSKLGLEPAADDNRRVLAVLAHLETRAAGR